MQITEAHSAPESLSPIPLMRVGRGAERLNPILDELQNEQENLRQGESFSLRDNTARALRGFRWMDLSGIILGFMFAWALASGINSFVLGRSDPSFLSQDSFAKIIQSLLVACCVIVWFASEGHYRMRMPFWTETKKIINAMGLAMLTDIFFRFVLKQDFSRSWMISGWMFATIGILCFRFLWRRHKRKQGAWKVRTLLVGRGKTATEARHALASEPELGFDIIAQIDNLPAAFEQARHSWQTLCAMHKADYVMIALDGTDLMSAEPAFAQLMRECVPFSVSPPLHKIPVHSMVSQHFFNHDVMLLTHNHGLNQWLPRFMKRAFDIVVASSTLLVLSPILLVVALIVKMDGGPALFGHKRLGRNGKSFSCLKFRSMNVNSDAVLKKKLAEIAEARIEWQRDHKLRNDPRVTGIGKFLRSASIDELPQLVNVLRGEMSIVGPRPIIVAETEKYDNDISHYYRVRPGITGVWQISGRNDVSYAQRVQMDSWYVCNWSLWCDIKIICKTFPAVLKRAGAY